MKTESKVLLRSEYTEPLIAEAQRVAALGGSFSMENVFNDNWYLVVKIQYPDEIKTEVRA
jgi:hypothetical protein